MNKTLSIKEIQKDAFNSHIFPFFWMRGEDEETLRTYVRKVYEANIREICVESRPHPDFMGDSWFDDLAILIDELEKHDMQMWLFDDGHFPTGYANGLLEEQYPELKKELLYYRKMQVVGPQKNIQIRTDIIQAMKVDTTAKIIGVVGKSCESVINLGLPTDNMLELTLPEGDWEIFIVYTTRQSDYNPSYINMVDKESCSKLIEATYTPTYERFAKYFGNTIKGFFTDEPGFMNEKGLVNDSLIGKNMPLPWSAEVSEEMRMQYGDDYIMKLIDLWGPKEDEVADIRHYYMDVVTRAYKENFCDQIGDWCRNRGVEYIGHVIEDRDSHARLGVGVGHFFRSMMGQDMSGVDIVLNQLLPGKDYEYNTIRGTWDGEFFHYLLARLGSSLAHIDPTKKDRTMAEIFGAFGWHEGITLMKWITDHFLVRGVNNFIPHAFSMQPFPDNDCPPHFYAHGNNPQFPVFGILMKYLNKMSTLLNDGKSLPVAAVLYHAEAEWTGDFMYTQKPAKILTQLQMDFDVIPSDVFLWKDRFNTDTQVGLTINTLTYPILIIPYAEYITEEVYAFIKDQKNITEIIVLDKLPSKVINGGVIDASTLAHIKVLAAEELYTYLQTSEHRVIKTKTEYKWLRAYAYKKETEMYHMFFNEHPSEYIQTTVELPQNPYKYCYEVNLLTEEYYDVTNEEPAYTLALMPNESVMYIFTDTEITTSDRKIKDETAYLVLQEKVSVQYTGSLTYPNYGQSVELPEYLNLMKIEQFQNKTGYFKYKLEVAQENLAEYPILDLGQIHESATVYVNGQNVGTRIANPYTFDLSDYLKTGNVQLEIEMTNTVVNERMDVLSLAEPIYPTGLLTAPKLYKVK